MYLRCGYCGYVLNWEKGELSPCKECHAKVWVALDAPKTPYKLSERDRLFLRENRIAPEV